MPDAALVLSGGMAKGAYQIGALQAVNEYFKPAGMKYLSAASIGALNTYAYLTDGLDKGTRLWSSVENGNNRKWVTALLKTSFLQESISKIISDVKIAGVFYIPLFSIKKRKLFYIDVSKIPACDLKQYLLASVAMPIYNKGISINGDCYYDGAIIDNIPIYPILKHNIDYMICIYFDDNNYTFENDYLDNKIIKINFSDNKVISSSICFGHDAIEYMISEGYKRAKSILGFVFKNGIDDIDTIYSQIEELNRINAQRKLRITGDIIVNNMNKVAKKLMRKPELL